MLLIAGTEDYVVPKSVVEKEMTVYNGFVVELQVFQGRTHGVVNQNGWDEIADVVVEGKLSL